MTILSNGIEIHDPIIFHTTTGGGQGAQSIFITRATETNYVLSRVPCFPDPSKRFAGSRHVYRWGELLAELDALEIKGMPSLCHTVHNKSLTELRTSKEPVYGPDRHMTLHEDFSKTSLISLSVHRASGTVFEHYYVIDESLPLGELWRLENCDTFKNANEALSHFYKRNIERQTQLAEVEKILRAIERALPEKL